MCELFSIVMKELDELESCKNCDSADWISLLEQSPPTAHPERSEVVKYILRCGGCRKVARVYEEDGFETYSGALRGQKTIA